MEVGLGVWIGSDVEVGLGVGVIVVGVVSGEIGSGVEVGLRVGVRLGLGVRGSHRHKLRPGELIKQRMSLMGKI
jgi:hypothetical protein